MKIFLFLYPIREYVEQSIAGSPKKRLALQRLNKIINVRYRQNNYQVFWLLFSQENKPKLPNLSLLDPNIRIHKKDRIISAGLSRKKHRQYIYPSPRKILLQLGHISSLVIGGFHQSDCVDKIARTAHRDSIDVRVDEDTTDQFFKTLILQGLPPITRNQKEYAVSYLNLLKSLEKELGYKIVSRAIKEHRISRKRRPWLAQI